ncbi:MAG: arylsulfatase A-like enzyme [Candidatus Promineifilaceae bacterium]|jgi:arylsulfatase A-like enzyme
MKKMFRSVFGVALTVACFVLSVAAAQGAASSDRLNIVFILVDDLGWADIGAYGSSFYETPNVDALAASGMLFTDGYAACPVCSPSRAAILSGKYPARMDTTDWFGGKRNGKLIAAPYRDSLPLEEQTLSEALLAEGYKTFFAGKWHLGGKSFEPEQQGFEINKGGHHRGSPPGGYFSPYNNPKLADGPNGECLPDRLGDESVRFLRENAANPFLLYLSFYSVHTPLQTKADYKEKYTKKAADVVATTAFAPVCPQRNNEARQVQKHPVYAGMMQSMDENVGKVLDALEELGLTDKTVVCFTSDNGGLSTSEGRPTSNLPLKAGKGWLYEGGVRVPFIIRWPGVTTPASTSSVPVIGNDFYPTLLQAANLAPLPEQHRDGVSLRSLLDGSSATLGRKALFWHYPHYGNQGGRPGSSVRVGDFKLIETFEDDMLELYNLKDDIGELRDLSAEMPEKTAELKQMLVAWRTDVDAKMMKPNPARQDK